MIKSTDMDLLSVTHGIITHLVNCQGVMGVGLALKVRNLYPKAYKRYRAFKFKPGQIQLVKVTPDLYVCNLAGQDKYGRDRRYTDYTAVKTGFSKLDTWASQNSLRVNIPSFMGCGNAGGDWKVISRIISETLVSCEYTICYLTT